MNKITLKRSLFLGDRSYAKGETATVDEERARQLVALGHAAIAVELPPIQKAVAPTPGNATAPKPPASAPVKPENAKAK